MHIKAKKRIEKAKKVKDTRPIIKLPTTGKTFDNLIGGIDRLCDKLLKSSDMDEQERSKVAWLKSRLNI